MATLKYWLWLSTRKGLRPEHMDRLLEHFGTPEAAYFADPAEYGLLEGLPQAAGETLLDKDLAGAEAIPSEKHLRPACGPLCEGTAPRL